VAVARSAADLTVRAVCGPYRRRRDGMLDPVELARTQAHLSGPRICGEGRRGQGVERLRLRRPAAGHPIAALSRHAALRMGSTSNRGSGCGRYGSRCSCAPGVGGRLMLSAAAPGILWFN
jgi:hypothetical protein